MYKVKRFSSESDKKNNAGRNAALVGAAGLGATGVGLGLTSVGVNRDLRNESNSFKNTKSSLLDKFKKRFRKVS